MAKSVGTRSPRAARSPRRSAAASPETRPRSFPPGLGFTPKAEKKAPKVESPAGGAVAPPAAAEGTLPCLAYVVMYHIVGVGGLVWWHASQHAVLSPMHIFLSVFCVINAWIAVCEISLLFYSAEIQKQHAAFGAKFGEGVLPPVFLFQRVRARELLSLKYWAVMWSTYCALDPSYADTTTFGFCVDVGNGMTTLLPTVLFAVGMSSPVLSARALGMLGLLKFYQELYGTCVYFFQYVFNQRYLRSPSAHVWGIVVPANGIWMVGPAVGMWACSRLILEGSFDVFQSEGLSLAAFEPPPAPPTWLEEVKSSFTSS